MGISHFKKRFPKPRITMPENFHPVTDSERWEDKKEGWIAALKWVIEMFNRNIKSPEPIFDVKEEIENELQSLTDE